jgi:predicted DNA-binding transcriptional regulator YafY
MARVPPPKRPDNAIERQQRLLRVIELLQAQRTVACSVAHLLAQAAGSGLQIELRTLQRDLIFLERVLPGRVLRSEHGGWGWHHAATQGLRLAPQHSELWLTLSMVENHLDKAMPAAVMADLTPLFVRARTHLEGPLTRTYQRWRDGIGVSSGLQMLKPPLLDPVQLAEIQQALREQTLLEFDYHDGTRVKTGYRVVALALVLDDGATYLVGHRLDDKAGTRNPRVYAVHRITGCRNTGMPAPVLPQFELDDYLQRSHNFAFPIDPEVAEIELVLLVRPEAARLFRERRLSERQDIKEQDDGSLVLRAWMVDSLRLQWFLLSYGDSVEVLAPARLCKRIHDVLKRALKPYRHTPRP